MLRQLYALLLVVLALAAANARYSLGIRDSIMVWHPFNLAVRYVCAAAAQIQLTMMSLDRPIWLQASTHSFHDKEFGPAQQLHGATYTCDVDFSCESLAPKLNWVIDIGVASAILSKVLAKYNFQNLNEMCTQSVVALHTAVANSCVSASFVQCKTTAARRADVNTTTEFMCRAIYDDLIRECPEFEGDICVKLWESHKAWACYTGSTSKPATVI
eukprot:6843-Heterococcus_DN1.PRE.3